MTPILTKSQTMSTEIQLLIHTSAKKTVFLAKIGTRPIGSLIPYVGSGPLTHIARSNSISVYNCIDREVSFLGDLMTFYLG